MSASQPYASDALLKAAWRRRWAIVLPAIVVAAAASWWIHRLPDRYRADTMLLLVPQRVPESFVRSTVSPRGDNRLQWLAQQILTRTQLERIVRDFDLYAEARKTQGMEEIVESMRKRDIAIQLVKGDAFRLGFIADSPDISMRVAEQLSALFIGQTSLDRATQAEGADQFLEAQLADVRRKLVDDEAKLEEYRRHHNGELPRQLDANLQGLRNTELQMQALTESLNRDRDRQLVIERSIRDASLVEIADGGAAGRPRVASGDGSKLTAAEQLERAESALRNMQATMTAQHPDIVALQQTVADLRTRAAAESARPIEPPDTTVATALRRNRLEELRAELALVQGQIAQRASEGERLRNVLLNYQRRIEAEPTREAELASLTRDYDTLQQTYRTLLAKKQESEIAANLERQQLGAQFKVLDPARLPDRPFAPNRARLYPIAGLAGLGLGLALAILLEWRDRGMRTEDEVLAALGVPVLATIPLAPSRGGRRRAR